MNLKSCYRNLLERLYVDPRKEEECCTSSMCVVLKIFYFSFHPFVLTKFVSWHINLWPLSLIMLGIPFCSVGQETFHPPLCVVTGSLVQILLKYYYNTCNNFFYCVKIFRLPWQCTAINLVMNKFILLKVEPVQVINVVD